MAREEGGKGGRRCVYTGGLIFEMLIGFQIWRVCFLVGGLYTGGRINRILRYLGNIRKVIV